MYGVSQWMEGLPGPYRDYYLARAPLSNIHGALKLWDYERGHLPAAVGIDDDSGARWSWRIEVYEHFVLPSRDQEMPKAADGAIPYSRSKTWNDPDNLRLQSAGRRFFAYQPYYRKWTKPNDFATYYKAVTGPDTGFDPERSSRLSDLPHDLVLVVRVEESETHWMEPGDLDVEELLRVPDPQSLLASPVGKDGYAVLFADGEKWVLSSELPWYDLYKFFTLTGASQYDREQVLGRYRVRPWW
jgi:hypothetical protein